MYLLNVGIHLQDYATLQRRDRSMHDKLPKEIYEKR
jgi:hypothetical protein